MRMGGEFGMRPSNTGMGMTPGMASQMGMGMNAPPLGMDPNMGGPPPMNMGMGMDMAMPMVRFFFCFPFCGLVVRLGSHWVYVFVRSFIVFVLFCFLCFFPFRALRWVRSCWSRRRRSTPVVDTATTMQPLAAERSPHLTFETSITHTHTQTHTHTNTQTYIHTHTNTHTHIHTHTQYTHTHTYTIHTHARLFVPPRPSIEKFSGYVSFVCVCIVCACVRVCVLCEMW